MKIAALHGHGDADVLGLAQAPTPTPGPHEVLIRVAAAGVNRADVLQRQGHYDPPPGAPAWPGLEVAGVVEAVGHDVTAWSPGDEVCALLSGGGYAELAVVDATLVLPVPAGVSLEEAAALPEAACTVWSTLDAAGAAPGHTLLVHGGAGGIGSMAVQYGAARGMRVLATAGTPAKVARCRELGADAACDYHDDWPAWVAQQTQGRGVDVILDVVGGAYLEPNVAALATGGTLAVIGMQRGSRGTLDLGRLLARRARVLGTTLRSRPLAERSRIVAGVRAHVWPLIPRAVRPVVDSRYPLARAADAHRRLESGEASGTILLLPGES